MRSLLNRQKQLFRPVKLNQDSLPRCLTRSELPSIPLLSGQADKSFALTDDVSNILDEPVFDIPVPGNSSMVGCVEILLNTALGSGTLMVPYCYTTGMVAAILISVLFAIIGYFALDLMIESSYYCKKYDYRGLFAHTFGKNRLWIVNVMIAIVQFGACTIYCHWNGRLISHVVNSDNIIKISGTSLEQAVKRNGYVYGQSVRGADDEFKSWVLSGDYRTDIIKDDDGNEIIFKHKSRIHPKKMYVTRDDKGKTKSGNKKREYILVDQKQMVYYSQKYADKQKRDREMIIKKANDLINHPELYTRATSYGVAGYVNNLKFVKGTGEVADASNLSLNIERIKEEEKYDGYYSIVTSEENLSDIEIRNIYRGLSKIEETFKVTKSGLESRPVWVSRADHIESHFLTCFIALVIIRLLEIKLNNKYSFKKTIETVRNYTSNHVVHDVYLQGFRNNVIKDIENVFSIDLSRKFLTLSEIKKILN